MGQELQLVTEQKLSLGPLTTSQEAGPPGQFFSRSSDSGGGVAARPTTPAPRSSPMGITHGHICGGHVGRVPQAIFLFLQPCGQVLPLSSPAPS